MGNTFNAASDHAALMDQVYRRQRYVYDASRACYLLGRDHLIGELRPGFRHNVLEIGCGTARNLIAAARRYPQARFYGIDISPKMLEWGARSIARAGLADRIILAEADATNFSPETLFGLRGFDRAFASYSLSMIPGWRGAVTAGLSCLNTDGRLHIVDFGQCEGLPSIFKTALDGWLARFHVRPRKNLGVCLEEVAAAQNGTHRLTPLYRGYAWYGEVSLDQTPSANSRNFS